jgi:hypothetical protein
MWLYLWGKCHDAHLRAWYVAYPLTLRYIQGMMQEGVAFGHTFQGASLGDQGVAGFGRNERVDETHIKVTVL